MSLIYITGPTGAGKSTVGGALSQKGYKVIDTDTDGVRYWISKKTNKLTDLFRKDEKITNDYKTNHFVGLSENFVIELKAMALKETVFLCGTVANDLDMRKYFDKIILLDTSGAVQKERIQSRTNDFYGSQADQLTKAMKWRSAQVGKYIKAGAIKINAEQPINKVVDDVLMASNIG